MEELSSTKQKLISRINELKEEVARETSLRASLESSHTTLMSRIHETEVMAEKDRKEVCFKLNTFKPMQVTREQEEETLQLYDQSLSLSVCLSFSLSL